ncbi:GIY-YIG nuclease family protein [Candidatus Daviesbacteria bacterium]|nr:GIY-YIG nuclease family protein [Candidatus Daviesbacteria bacterium]
MSGPYQLNTQNVNSYVSWVSAGAYILSRDGTTGHYVGRSDVNLAQRLNQHVNNNTGRYTHFWFENSNSAKSAFDLECRWYHVYNPSDNQNHPDRGNNSDWQCPNCNIFNTGRGWY